MARSTEHPAPDDLARLAASGDGAAREHLETGCLRCIESLRRQLVAGAPAARRAVFTAIMEDAAVMQEGAAPQPPPLPAIAANVRGWWLLLRAERAAAPDLVAELLTLPAPARRTALRERRRFQLLGLAELFAARTRHAVLDDPALAIELGALAVEAADRLPSAGYPPGIADDQRALAWAALGNAHRVAAELFDAERAFVAALGLTEGGSGSPAVRGEVLSLLGSLRTDQTRYGEAAEILAEAAELYRAVGDPAGEGKVLYQQANAVGYGGEPARAAELLAAARERIAAGGERVLGLEAAQAHAWWLAEAGAAAAARALFASVEEQCRNEVEGFAKQQRLAWLGARIARAEGDADGAAEQLRQVRQAFLEREEAYDYALVSLDLAALYLEAGRTSEVRRMAEELIPLFASRQIAGHAAEALVLFVRAAVTEEATAAFVRELASFLERARHNPYVRFEAAG